MNINQLMKQAKQMQEKMAKQQEELAHKEFEGSSGGGMVVAKVNGVGSLLALKIDPEVINKDDKDMLEDLVVAAVNQAVTNAHQNSQTDMMGMMNQMGIKLPGL